jgi:hypothetical protein
MVVGMDAIFAYAATQDLRGAVGNDLIGVHVVTGPRACLDGIDYKLVVPFPLNHFLRRLDDRIRTLKVKQAKVAVDFCRSALYRCHRPNKCGPRF